MAKRKVSTRLGGQGQDTRKRSPRPGMGKPYARFREMVFLFSAVASGGGTAVGQTSVLNNDYDITYKRGAMGISSTSVHLNNLWQIAIEYISGEKVTTPAATSGTSLAIASAVLGVNGVGGYIDPPLRVRATVQMQVTVQNNDSGNRNLCVVFGLREWYFSNDAES